MALRIFVVPLVWLFLFNFTNGNKTETDGPPKNYTVILPRIEKAEQPSNLVPWFDMMHSFVDDMYESGKTPLIILWIDGSMTKLKEGSDDSGEVFTQVNREGHRRVFYNLRSAVFVIFLLILTVTLIISGWFTCGYRIIGLCGTRPSHPLDNNQAVAFRICMISVMLCLVIPTIILIYFALVNTIFANTAFSGPPVQEMDREIVYINQWVSNFSEKYAGNGTVKHFAPTNEDILKAVTDAYRGYYGYVFEKAGFHLLEYELKVLAKYTYYVIQSYYQIIAAHSAFSDKIAKVNSFKNDFTTNFNKFLNVCTNCQYYQPFQNNIYFNSLDLNQTLADFIYGVSNLKKDELFGTHYEFVSKRLHDIHSQIPQNKSLYKELVTFLKNASDTYYAITFKQIQTSISNFVTTFKHLSVTLRLSSNQASIYASHYARHAFTIIFCVALLVAIVITLVALVLGCVLAPRPLSEELPYDKYRCRELPAIMLNVAAIIVFITIICILIFVITIFIVGVPFEWGYCQFLTERQPNGLIKLSEGLSAHNPESSINGLFSSLLRRCLQGRGTLYEMLHMKDATDWNTTYAFLKRFNSTAEAIYHVPEFMEHKFPAKHAFLDFCDFYEKAVTRNAQTNIEKLPENILNLKFSKSVAFESHELPLEMRDLRDKDKGNLQVAKLYDNLVTIVSMDLLVNSLKHSYRMAHPWRYLDWHLRSVKDLYQKARTWFYSPERISSSKNMFLKFSAASMNLLFKDALKKDMPCTGVGESLDLYFYNFCRMFVDPWNATWLIFLFMLLVLFPLLLGLFVLILCYRKQNDRKLSDLQHLMKSCCGKKHEGDEIPPEPVPTPRKKKEESEESDSDSSIAIIGFNHGCYIFCRTFTICSNFLVYLLLCKWKDRKKRAKRMNADPQKRRSISELPDNFFPAPVVVPLGCGPHLVGRCCCLKLEKWKKSDLEEDMKKMERKKQKKMLKKQKKKDQAAQQLLPKAGKGESLRERLLNEARDEKAGVVLSGEPGLSESEVSEEVQREPREELISRKSSGVKQKSEAKSQRSSKRGSEPKKSDVKSQRSSQRGSEAKKSDVEGQRSSQRGSEAKKSDVEGQRSSQRGSEAKKSDVKIQQSSQRGSEAKKSDVEGQRSSQRGSEAKKSDVKSQRSSQRGSEAKKSDVKSQQSSQRGSKDEEL